MKRFSLFLLLLSCFALNQAQDTYHTNLQASLQTENNLPVGSWMFYDNEAAITSTAASFGNVTTFPVPMAQPFSQQVNLRLNSMPTNPFSSQWNIRNKIALNNGDVILAVFYLRAVGAKGKVSFFIEHATNYNKEMYLTMPVDTQWRRFLIPVEVTSAYGVDGLTFGFHLGYQAQTIEVGGFTALNYGNNAPLSQLPNKTNNQFYDGWEPNAPWRAAADVRIDQLRKADLTLNLTDTGGNPVPNAKVNVKMLKHQFAFGTAVTGQRIAGNNDYNRIYENKLLNLDGKGHGFNWIVFENDMKWPAWEDSWLVNKTELVDAVTWLRDQDIKIRGHTLVWPGNNNMPSDVHTNINDLTYVKNRINNHIKAILEYPGLQGQVAEWDVINETLTNQDLENTFRGTAGYPTGREILAEIFKKAREEDSTTGLWLNDYITISLQQEAGAAQYDGLMRNLGELISAGTDIEGVGFQAHIGGFPNGISSVMNTLDDFYQTHGLTAKITEFDMPSYVTDSLAATYMRDFMKVAFSHPSMNGFFSWSFWDGATWNGANSNLFDINWNMTLQGSTYVDLVFNEWWTDETVSANASGEAKTRAFKGQYEISYICDGALVRDTLNLVDNQTINIVCDNITTGFEQFQVLDVRVYPNPGTGLFHIERASASQAVIRIKDMKGKVLFSQDSLERNSSIDLSELAKGIYLLEIQSEQGRYVEKLMLR